jgi:small subunit ribosomal protein S16
VAVKIKLKRMGKIRAPFYRIIVADARTKRDGRAIEEIGKYHPKVDPSLIEVDSDRAQYWLSVGAQPTDPVRRLLEITGDWQKFKGLPGAEGTLKTAAPRPDKRDAFAAAVAETVKDLKVKGKAGDARAADGKAAETKADKGRARKPAAGAKTAGAKSAKDDAAKDEAAAKGSTAKADVEAKDDSAKDGAAKDGAAKEATAKEATAKEATAKEATAKDGAAKEATPKEATA